MTTIHQSPGAHTEENPLPAQQSGRRRGRFLGRRRVVPAATLVLTALVVGACGGASSSGSAAGSSSDPGSAGSGRPQFAANFGAVSGKVVSIDSAGAAVRSATGTTTVAWATSTRFSKVSSVPRSSLATGDCVAVTSTNPDADSAASRVIAASVSVTSTTGCGQQSGGFGGGTPPTGGPSNGGTGGPHPIPSGSPGSRGGFGGGFRGHGFGGAFGTIASISTSSFVVTSLFGSGAVTVKTTAATTVTTTSSATSAALVTGACAAAIGSKASAGTIDARSITISSPHNDTCPTTRAFPGGRGFGGGGRGFGSSPPVTSA